MVIYTILFGAKSLERRQEICPPHCSMYEHDSSVTAWEAKKLIHTLSEWNYSGCARKNQYILNSQHTSSSHYLPCIYSGSERKVHDLVR